VIPPANSFALRVSFFEQGLVELTPSYGLGLTVSPKIHTNPDKLPEFITCPIVLLKMLSNGERINKVGKKYKDNMYYVYVDSDEWSTFLKDSATDFLTTEGE
jgi:hypothetical protein